MKTKNVLIWSGLVIIPIIISYLWGVWWNIIYFNDAKTFFLWNRVNDIKDTIGAAINEELLWRFIPLVIISFILSSLKYESNKEKKCILCSISFIIILLIQMKFGISHYSEIYETQEWITKHIVLQGTMGLFYATAYNIIQYHTKKTYNIHLIISHIIALLSSIIIHSTVNSMLIIRFTCWDVTTEILLKKPFILNGFSRISSVTNLCSSYL